MPFCDILSLYKICFHLVRLRLEGVGLLHTALLRFLRNRVTGSTPFGTVTLVTPVVSATAEWSTRDSAHTATHDTTCTPTSGEVRHFVKVNFGPFFGILEFPLDSGHAFCNTLNPSMVVIQK